MIKITQPCEHRQATIFVGCDVSATCLYFAYHSGQNWQEQNIPNQWDSIESYVKEIALQQEQAQIAFHFIVEATGTYSSKLIYAFCRENIKVSVVSPHQSSWAALRYFFKMKNKSQKNDRADARLLAEYGNLNQKDLKVYVAENEHYFKIRQYMNAIAQLEKLKMEVLSQLHAHQQLPPARQNEVIVQLYKQNIAQFEAQIIELDKELSQIQPLEIGAEESKKYIKSVVGIGEKMANLFIVQTGGLDKFQTAKQLAKFIGITPTQHQSGTSIRSKGRTSKKGNITLRKTLYVATWSAIRFNKAAKALYQRLKQKGKPSKVALIAVANLLVRQVFVVAKKKILFDNQYFERFLPTI
ncbi:MAG: IS110 family transposase [Thermonemataceae bacterium]|nr:IS110 family transposase [Thermonemataceae bacterium]